MGWFSCAEPRKPARSGTSFRVHRPPSEEWLYGSWLGSTKQCELNYRWYVDHEREAPRQQPNRNHFPKHPLQNIAAEVGPRYHQMPPQGHLRDSNLRWAPLAAIEANERYGPRGRNEGYEHGDDESVDERYEPAYAKLNSHSSRQGRSHRQEQKEVRGRWEDVDPWIVDVSLKMPKLASRHDGPYRR